MATVAGIGPVALATPLDLLQTQAPQLARLYAAYPQYGDGLSRYAAGQGFSRPVERLATVVHELIHIDSAAHQGYYIDGVYYEPYLAASAWPSLRNEEVGPWMRGDEKGNIYSLYMRATPKNTLGNALDEVNAYGQVLPFVCRNEADSADRQIRNLLGQLYVVEAFLRVARMARPEDYRALTRRHASAGALKTITGRAWYALVACGVPAAQLPNQETRYLLERME
ncbi:hypothetical protein [Rugamonas aquatica]|uniref:Uncharacterized protein n=1 Tax=Rugamonas aquatica TaxID=2743357 RepID=A0A6A7N793_9BURK|nr:hypothetical protein [Rugamonas aquatica]MQA40758.1 hypothetical protein [Rugamonas aquatica]